MQVPVNMVSSVGSLPWVDEYCKICGLNLDKIGTRPALCNYAQQWAITWLEIVVDGESTKQFYSRTSEICSQ